VIDRDRRLAGEEISECEALLERIHLAAPADDSCGTGIGNPSIQSPVQKRLRAP
jgi:hypothetical protein